MATAGRWCTVCGLARVQAAYAMVGQGCSTPPKPCMEAWSRAGFHMDVPTSFSVYAGCKKPRCALQEEASSADPYHWHDSGGNGARHKWVNAVVAAYAGLRRHGT